MQNQHLVAVVDDDESFRIALVDSLSSVGYDACGYASADEFIAAAADTTCHCVITDIHMPGMNGFELKQHLASRASAMPVIMITARTEPDLESKAAAVGAVCLLRKPFATDALVKCLDRVLNP